MTEGEPFPRRLLALLCRAFRIEDRKGVSPSGPREIRHSEAGATGVYTDQDLDGHDFSRRCLIGAEFRNCKLRTTNFSGADLSYAVFVECDLYRADITNACLYATQIRDCDATKADFTGALLSGVRLVNVDVTHVVFDAGLPIGRVRKPQKIQPGFPQQDQRFAHVAFSEHIGDVKTLEESFDGVYLSGFDRAIVFSDDPPNERWRSNRRREEVAKILKQLLLSNGYYERAMEYYYLERRYRRLSIPWRSSRAFHRFVDFLTGEMLWGYGTRVSRVIASYSLATVASAATLVLLPILGPYGGIARVAPSGIPLLVRDPAEIPDVSYYLLTAAFGNASYEAIGWGKGIFVFYCLIALVLLSLLFASVARRLANI